MRGLSEPAIEEQMTFRRLDELRQFLPEQCSWDGESAPSLIWSSIGLRVGLVTPTVELSGGDTKQSPF